MTKGIMQNKYYIRTLITNSTKIVKTMCPRNSFHF